MGGSSSPPRSGSPRPRSSRRALARLVGLWAWRFTIFRELYSVFSDVCNFLAEKPLDSTCYLWESVRQELQVVAALAPICARPLDLAWSHAVLMTDASEEGFGVVSTQASPEDLARVSVRRETGMGDACGRRLHHGRDRGRGRRRPRRHARRYLASERARGDALLSASPRCSSSLQRSPASFRLRVLSPKVLRLYRLHGQLRSAWEGPELIPRAATPVPSLDTVPRSLRHEVLLPAHPDAFEHGGRTVPKLAHPHRRREDPASCKTSRRASPEPRASTPIVDKDDPTILVPSLRLLGARARMRRCLPATGHASASSSAPAPAEARSRGLGARRRTRGRLPAAGRHPAPRACRQQQDLPGLLAAT